MFVLSVHEMLIIILKQHITEINTNNCPQTQIKEVIIKNVVLSQMKPFNYKINNFKV